MPREWKDDNFEDLMSSLDSEIFGKGKDQTQHKTTEDIADKFEAKEISQVLKRSFESSTSSKQQNQCFEKISSATETSEGQSDQPEAASGSNTPAGDSTNSKQDFEPKYVTRRFMKNLVGTKTDENSQPSTVESSKQSSAKLKRNSTDNTSGHSLALKVPKLETPTVSSSQALPNDKNPIPKSQRPKTGDIVWVNSVGFPHWPAKVEYVGHGRIKFRYFPLNKNTKSFTIATYSSGTLKRMELGDEIPENASPDLEQAFQEAMSSLEDRVNNDQTWEPGSPAPSITPKAARKINMPKKRPQKFITMPKQIAMQKQLQIFTTQKQKFKFVSARPEDFDSPKSGVVNLLRTDGLDIFKINDVVAIDTGKVSGWPALVNAVDLSGPFYAYCRRFPIEDFMHEPRYKMPFTSLNRFPKQLIDELLEEYQEDSAVDKLLIKGLIEASQFLEAQEAGRPVQQEQPRYGGASCRNDYVVRKVNNWLNSNSTPNMSPLSRIRQDIGPPPDFVPNLEADFSPSDNSEKVELLSNQIEQLPESEDDEEVQEEAAEEKSENGQEIQEVPVEEDLVEGSSQKSEDAHDPDVQEASEDGQETQEIHVDDQQEYEEAEGNSQKVEVGRENEALMRQKIELMSSGEAKYFLMNACLKAIVSGKKLAQMSDAEEHKFGLEPSFAKLITVKAVEVLGEVINGWINQWVRTEDGQLGQQSRSLTSVAQARWILTVALPELCVFYVMKTMKVTEQGARTLIQEGNCDI